MFVLSTQENVLYRVIAILVTVSLVMWGLGAHIKTAQAANLTFVKNTLTTSAPSTLSNHEIEFVVPVDDAVGLLATETIVVTFPAAFTGTSTVLATDIDLEVNGTDRTLVGTMGDAAAGAAWGVDWVGNDLTFTSGTDTIGEGATVTIKIGSNATTGGAGVTRILNPAGSNQSYEFFISFAPGGSHDTGETQVAIVDTVLVTAQVNTTFDFLVSGFATAGTPVNGTSTTGTTTATSIPFGVLVAGEIKTLAQELQVRTNAINGYVVTVQTDQQLESSTGADIDGFANGTYIDTPATWAANPLLNNIANENTWGHWGLTTEDINLLGAGADFGSNEWVSASTTPRAIMAHDGPADFQTPNIGSTTVGYQIEITALQEAGDDYQAILTYIATPTF